MLFQLHRICGFPTDCLSALLVRIQQESEVAESIHRRRFLSVLRVVGLAVSNSHRLYLVLQLGQRAADTSLSGTEAQSQMD